MVKKVTNGISVSVNTLYRETQSNPSAGYFVFSYFISIQNHSEETFQLKRRHWHIIDSSGEYREVEGPGVVGQQPVLRPGERYEYESSCHFTTEIGKMYGTFMMERLMDRQIIEVDIPEFLMVVPSRLN